MGSPFLGEIRMFGGNFAPVGWMFCQGQLLPITRNEALFALIGTTYGGDGRSTFALPDLQIRFTTQQDNSFVMGQFGGTASATWVPGHSHIPVASNAGGSDSPNTDMWAVSTNGKQYSNVGGGGGAQNVPMVQTAGGNPTNDNMHPFQCIAFIISLFGIFSQRT